MIKQTWSKIKHWLEHYHAITGWVISILPEIREEVAKILDGNTRLAIQRVVTKLHVPPIQPKTSEESLEIILDILWK